MQLAAGAVIACGVLEDSSLRCFGPAAPSAHVSTMLGRTPPGTGWALASVSVNSAVLIACGLRLNGTAECWQEEVSATSYFTPPPADRLFRQLVVGWWHACGVLRPPDSLSLADQAKGGEVKCWGSNGDLQGNVFAGQTGYAGACVLAVVGNTCVARVCAPGYVRAPPRAHSHWCPN